MRKFLFFTVFIGLFTIGSVLANTTQSLTLAGFVPERNEFRVAPLGAASGFKAQEGLLMHVYESNNVAQDKQISFTRVKVTSEDQALVIGHRQRSGELGNHHLVRILKIAPSQKTERTIIFSVAAE